MRKGLLVAGVTLALLGAFLALAAPHASAQVARPIDSGADLSLSVGQVFRPGDLVEIHFFVTDNASLVDPVWPDPWPHLHPPNLGSELPDGTTQGLIILEKPVLWGHTGAQRVAFSAPEAPGLYAIHGAAIVNDVMIFGYASFTVVTGQVAVEVSLATSLSIAALVVAVITLTLVSLLIARQKR